MGWFASWAVAIKNDASDSAIELQEVYSCACGSSADKSTPCTVAHGKSFELPESNRWTHGCPVRIWGKVHHKTLGFTSDEVQLVTRPYAGSVLAGYGEYDVKRYATAELTTIMSAFRKVASLLTLFEGVVNESVLINRPNVSLLSYDPNVFDYNGGNSNARQTVFDRFGTTSRPFESALSNFAHTSRQASTGGTSGNRGNNFLANNGGTSANNGGNNVLSEPDVLNTFLAYTDSFKTGIEAKNHAFQIQGYTPMTNNAWGLQTAVSDFHKGRDQAKQFWTILRDHVKGKFGGRSSSSIILSKESKGNLNRYYAAATKNMDSALQKLSQEMHSGYSGSKASYGSQILALVVYMHAVTVRVFCMLANMILTEIPQETQKANQFFTAAAANHEKIVNALKVIVGKHIVEVQKMYVATTTMLGRSVREHLKPNFGATAAPFQIRSFQGSSSSKFADLPLVLITGTSRADFDAGVFKPSKLLDKDEKVFSAYQKALSGETPRTEALHKKWFQNVQNTMKVWLKVVDEAEKRDKAWDKIVERQGH